MKKVNSPTKKPSLKEEKPVLKFEKFVDSKSAQAVMSITQTGLISLPRAVREGEHIRKFVILYFDKDSQILGLQFTEDQFAEGAIAVRAANSSNRNVAAQALLDYYKINYSELKHYAIEWNGELEMFTSCLAKALTKGKSRNVYF